LADGEARRPSLKTRKARVGPDILELRDLVNFPS